MADVKAGQIYALSSFLRHIRPQWLITVDWLARYWKYWESLSPLIIILSTSPPLWFPWIWWGKVMYMAMTKLLHRKILPLIEDVIEFAEPWHFIPTYSCEIRSYWCKIFFKNGKKMFWRQTEHIFLLGRSHFRIKALLGSWHAAVQSDHPVMRHGYRSYKAVYWSYLWS